MKSITWKIGGEAGFGIMTTGLMFSKIATRLGYYIFDHIEYPSLIRGGHNVYEVRVSDEPVYAQEYGIDVLIALNKETVTLHHKEMKPTSVILYDKEQFSLDDAGVDPAVELYHLPLTQLIKEAGATKLMENNVALGATMGMLGMDSAVLYALIGEMFAKKGDEVISENKNAAQKGYEYTTSNKSQKLTQTLPKIEQKIPHMVVSGNEAVGMGAFAAGCNLYIAYPMTPSSGVLHFMAEYGDQYGTVVKHAEDEISVINMAIGASYAGARAMIGTSGGGFSLMAEGLGLAGVTETPLVIFEGQRPGPATGMPTWTAQGDLQFLIHAAQDEFPRMIFAPGDATEAFYLTAHAFNVADYYQTPVFIMSDTYLAEGHQSVPVFDTKSITINRGKLLSWTDGDTRENYLRYDVTDDGIAWRALPGMKKALFLANSYEHNRYGWATEEIDARVEQVDRRNKKFGLYEKTVPHQVIYGDPNADLTLVAWGSTKGPVLQALAELKNEGFKKSVNFLHITAVWPLPAAQIADVLGSAKKTLLIEGNSQAQMGQLIRQETGVHLKDQYLRYDGRPFYPEDIKAKIKERLT